MNNVRKYLAKYFTEDYFIAPNSEIYFNFENLLKKYKDLYDNMITNLISILEIGDDFDRVIEYSNLSITELILSNIKLPYLNI